MVIVTELLQVEKNLLTGEGVCENRNPGFPPRTVIGDLSYCGGAVNTCCSYTYTNRVF